GDDVAILSQVNDDNHGIYNIAVIGGLSRPTDSNNIGSVAVFLDGNRLAQPVTLIVNYPPPSYGWPYDENGILIPSDSPLVFRKDVPAGGNIWIFTGYAYDKTATDADPNQIPVPYTGQLLVTPTFNFSADTFGALAFFGPTQKTVTPDANGVYKV